VLRERMMNKLLTQKFNQSRRLKPI